MCTSCTQQFGTKVPIDCVAGACQCDHECFNTDCSAKYQESDCHLCPGGESHCSDNILKPCMCNEGTSFCAQDGTCVPTGDDCPSGGTGSATSNQYCGG